MVERYAIGIDFGTDTVRALVVNVATGEEVGTAVSKYRRWSNGEFCDPDTNQYRQHPSDYVEGLEDAVKAALINAIDKTKDTEIGDKIAGIGVDTTGSTPVAVSKYGVPLALHEKWAKDPNAMFILWKDHTGVREAEEINAASARNGGTLTQFCGGTYSSEWFWSKILHTMRTASPDLVAETYSYVEHCDWIPSLLSGNNSVANLKRGRCSAGHKALWHEDSLPVQFLAANVDSRLAILENRLYSQTYTSDQQAGTLTREWAERLGIKEGTPIAVGAFDAHMGAVGNGIRPGMLSRIVGTSTCDMVVAPYDLMRQDGNEKLIAKICGQVDGSIIPGMYGLEAGQSAVGDIFANFRNWFVDMMITLGHPEQDREKLKNQIYKLLEARAETISPDKVPLVIDYHNGRRTPGADQTLTGAALGLTLATDAPKYFAGLVQGTCYTARQIVDTFNSQGVPINEVIACGGIADKSSFVMQTMADILAMPISVAKSGQTCALGAAMFGAVAGGAYDTVEAAQAHMGSGFKAVYSPRKEFVGIHDGRYAIFSRAVTTNENLLRQLK